MWNFKNKIHVQNIHKLLQLIDANCFCQSSLFISWFYYFFSIPLFIFSRILVVIEITQNLKLVQNLEWNGLNVFFLFSVILSGLDTDNCRYLIY